MADLSFYRQHYGVASTEEAFTRFLASLQTYYDALYYVDWAKVMAKAGAFRPEFYLLTSLCKSANLTRDVEQLLRDYPKVVRAIPALMACRGSISLLEDADSARVETLSFEPKEVWNEIEIERYVRFMGESGLLDLLANLDSVPDYMTGVEVGMDTNGRKNRSGTGAVKALAPHIKRVQNSFEGLEFWEERSFNWLRDRACPLTSEFRLQRWDGAFYLSNTRKWVLLEINHYGTTGSKPMSIANEYIARQRNLEMLGIGFIWVTDGLGWRSMQSALDLAFKEIPFPCTIQLARDGLLEHALRFQLGAK